MTIPPPDVAEVRKDSRVGVEPRHLGVERFGTVNAHQSLAAAELQHGLVRTKLSPTAKQLEPLRFEEALGCF